MNRLDLAVGCDRWQNQFKPGPAGGVLCGIGINFGTTKEPAWVWKWDGAENTDIEGVKGGISGSMKRTAVQWGMGRDLYLMPTVFATIVARGTPGAQYAKDSSGVKFYWLPPETRIDGDRLVLADGGETDRPKPASTQEEDMGLKVARAIDAITQITDPDKLKEASQDIGRSDKFEDHHKKVLLMTCEQQAEAIKLSGGK